MFDAILLLNPFRFDSLLGLRPLPSTLMQSRPTRYQGGHLTDVIQSHRCLAGSFGRAPASLRDQNDWNTKGCDERERVCAALKRAKAW